MEPVYLFDPWLVELHETDTPETTLKRYSALTKMQELHRKYAMRRVRFLTKDQLYEFYANYTKSQRNDVREIVQIIKSVLLTPTCQAQPVEIVDRSCPTLSAQWLNALGGSSTDWRRPIVVLPEARTANWPNHTLKGRELKYKINGSAEPTSRNLVCIERYDQHTYFEPDLDPWRFGAIGMPVETGTGERIESIQMLPRPFPLTFTFTQIFQELQARMEWSCGHTEKAYFIPEIGWDPRLITQKDWRENKIFGKAIVRGSRSKHDGRSGPIDREKHIWLWHSEERHWDVQLPGGGYWSVSYDGRVLKKNA